MEGYLHLRFGGWLNFFFGGGHIIRILWYQKIKLSFIDLRTGSEGSLCIKP